ncbi:hypothetical protein RMATCC62417_10964 [Rhizopus microsporus]|nr:hypothetical protein RMATCC62417_10964 [Rhizopus microsporus]
MYIRPNDNLMWGPFRRHTSQKVTPLVQLDETKPPRQAKKSQTCPNLSSIEDRPLPPLPKHPRASQKMTRAFSKGQMHLKRTTTWIGQPVQKLLSSPPMQNFGAMMSKKYQSATENMIRLQSNLQNHLPHLQIAHSDLTLEEDEEDERTMTIDDKKFLYGSADNHYSFIKSQIKEQSQSVGRLGKKIFVAPKRIMHCRVMQIINVGSERDCNYELTVYHNGLQHAIHRGNLRKIGKNLSADRPQEDAMRLEVQEPFSLTFAVAARYSNTRLRDGLAKIGIWPITQKTELPDTGYAVLTFEHKQDIKHHGITRFKLTKINDRRPGLFKWFNIELVVDVKIVEELPPTVQKFPWAYTLTENYSELTCESAQSSDITQDSNLVMASQQHCQGGDYLTIYTRGVAHPIWKRYWVAMNNHQLILYDFTYKLTKDPLHKVSLLPLQSVKKPTLDDCENVGIARKTGIMLQFDRLKATVGDEDIHFDDAEGLEGKMFVYCDDEAYAVHWRRALAAYAEKEIDKDMEDQNGVDLKFLW